MPSRAPGKDAPSFSLPVGKEGFCSSFRLTLRLGAVVVEVLLPLGGDQLAHIPDKQLVATAVRAKPVWTEEARQESVSHISMQESVWCITFHYKYFQEE